MKKAILLSGVCLACVAAGGLYFYKNGSISFAQTGTSAEVVAEVKEYDVSAYFDGNGDINAVNQKGLLPIVDAVMNKDAKAVKVLLEKGAKADATNNAGKKIIDIAFDNGDVATLAILDEIAQLNWRDVKYLDRAIDTNNVELVEYVLKHGGNANAILKIDGKIRPDEKLDYKDVRAITPLKKAIKLNNPKMAKLLLDNGAEGAEIFLEDIFIKADVEMVKALASHVNNLRQFTVKGKDMLQAALVADNDDLFDFAVEGNLGDLNEAFNVAISQKSGNKNYNELLDKFLSVGAVPSWDNVIYMLKKKNEKMFVEFSNCMIDVNEKIDSVGTSMLRYLVDNNYYKIAEMYVDKGANYWIDEKDGASVFQLAANRADNNNSLYKKLKSKLKGIDELGYSGETVLMMVAKGGQPKEFQNLVSEGADIWKKDYNDRTLIMYAAMGGNVQIIDYMIEQGDNVNGLDKDKLTPLMYAAKYGKLDAVKLLVKNGADVSAKDKIGKTALMYAAENGNIDVFETLINLGAASNGYDSNDKIVLMYAAEAGNVEVAQSLLRKGADVLHTDKKGVSVLSYGVQSNNTDMAKLLLGAGAKTDVYDKDGFAPYVYALKNKNKEMINLVRMFPFSNRKTISEGKSYIMYALETGDVGIINSETKYDVSGNDANGVESCMLLAKYGYLENYNPSKVCNKSKRDINGKNMLMYAAESQIIGNLVEVIKDLGNDASLVNASDNNGKTALMYEVGSKYNQAIKYKRLIGKGASTKLKDKDGKSVLMYLLGNRESRVEVYMISDFIRYGADVNSIDKNGKSVLMYAMENPKVSVSALDYLINSDVDLNAKDKNGKTVFMYAMDAQDITRIHMLLDKNVDTKAKDNEGNTALDYAKKKSRCFYEVVEKLLNN